MKSVAIFLTLVFLTGFQAAVLSDEPSPSIPESNLSVLEQIQEQLGKVSTKVTSSVNEGVETMKEHASSIMAYTTDLGKKYNVPKLPTRKFSNIGKDMQNLSHSALTRLKEGLKEQYKKARDTLVEMNNHSAMVALKDEMFKPIIEACQNTVNWLGEQSINSMTNMMYKKLGL